MPTNRTPLRRRVRGELTSDMEMALWLGVGRNGSFPFADEEEVEELWQRHRERLMEAHGRHGHRPMAWWWFEAPESLGAYDYDTERSTLYEAGLLDVDEAAALVAYWREEFERAHAPGFAVCMGMGDGPKGGAIWLRGAQARQAHFEWCDLPKSLLDRWTAERKAAAVPSR